MAALLLPFHFAQARIQQSQNQNAELSLAATHLLPSVAILPAGDFAFGSTVAYGLLGISEISSDIFYDAVGIYNGTLKIPIFQTDNFGFVIYGTYLTQEVKTLQTDAITGAQQEVKTQTSATIPGFTFSYRISSDIVGHIGAKSTLRTPALPPLTKKTAYVQGNQVFKEFAFALGEGVAIAIGGSYDLTYQYAGAGLTLHFPVISIGGHYFFGVDEGQFMPILGIGLQF